MSYGHHDLQSLASERTPVDGETGERAALAATIRRFLSSQISAFEFDAALEEYRNSSDPVVRFVVTQAWYFYDDCDDHLVALGKEAWDYFQRLLLLLTSDCKLETQSTRFWSWTQIVAAACLAVFAMTAVNVGWGQHLLLVSIPFGLVSILLSRIRRTPKIDEDPFTSVIQPFASFADLRRAYDSVHFVKSRYPMEIRHRRIRSPFMDRYHRFQLYAAWLLLAPVPLFFQMFPRTLTRTVAKMA